MCERWVIVSIASARAAGPPPEMWTREAARDRVELAEAGNLGAELFVVHRVDVGESCFRLRVARTSEASDRLPVVSRVALVARVLERDRLECQITSPRGRKLKLTGSVMDLEPIAEGSEELQSNPALLHNAWAYAKNTYLKVSLPTLEEQRHAERRAQAHKQVAEWITDLADDITDLTRWGWCSDCFTYAVHQKTKRPIGQLPAYVCGTCGSPTVPCAGLGCKNMAARGRGGVRVPRFCAEHRHEIPSFTRAEDKVDSLIDYEQFLSYDKPNLSAITKLAGVGIVGIALGIPAAFFAAPAIGGAVGTLLGGYSGAAATSWGLALLGGGSLAAGGLGMAGGTMVITALGGALGGGLGAWVTNAYVREDKSFRIEMLKGGTAIPVIVCNGFLSEGGHGWGEWKDIVTSRYPDSPVYRIHWGAKELKDLGILGSFGAVKVAAGAALKQAAMAATRAGAKKLGPLGPIMLGADLAKNPWHVAKNRADKTGVVVADLIARTNEPAWVLVGHSLGARVMAVTTQALGSKPDGPRIQAAHLTGAATDARCDPRALSAAVDEAVYNYHSSHDTVLRYLYFSAEGGQTAAGLSGFTPVSSRVANVDVSENVKKHTEYYENVVLRAAGPEPEGTGTTS